MLSVKSRHFPVYFPQKSSTVAYTDKILPMLPTFRQCCTQHATEWFVCVCVCVPDCFISLARREGLNTNRYRQIIHSLQSAFRSVLLEEKGLVITGVIEIG